MIGYIELDKKHPFLIGASAARDLEKIGKMGDVESVMMLGWCGLKYGYRAEKKEIPFTRDDFEVLIDLHPEYIGVISSEIKEQFGRVTEQLGNPKPPETS